MKRLLALAILLALACPGTGSATALFSAVGRLEHINSDSTCSAALVAPDIVLTAAHCVAGLAGVAAPPLQFRTANESDGTAYGVDRIVVHPLYNEWKDDPERNFRFDVAAVHLVRPVSGDVAAPLATGHEARIGERLFILSWRPADGPEPRKRECAVIEGVEGLVTLACNVQGGESGAPVIRVSDGKPEVVAVISSRNEARSKPVAQATNVARRLPPLLELMR